MALGIYAAFFGCGAILLLSSERRRMPRNNRMPRRDASKEEIANEPAENGTEVPENLVKGEPANAPDASPEIESAVLFGHGLLEGQVVDREGRGVPHAEVRCVPSLFECPPAEARRRFHATADGGGYFTFTKLPLTEAYRLHAFTKNRYGQVDIQGDPTGRRHLVRTEVWEYELLTFVDDKDEPVHVAGVQIQGDLFRGALSTAGVIGGWQLRALAFMSIKLPVKKNQIAMFYDSRVRPSKTRIFEFPGYKPTRIRTRVNPLSEWPKDAKIRLQPTSEKDRVVYTLLFPDLPWPDSWERVPDIHFYWIWKDVNAGTVLTRSSHSIIGRRGRAFELKPSYDPIGKPIEYRTRADGNRILVEPVLPRLGLVTLVYDGVREDALACILVNGWSHLRAVTEWPGRVRVGPLPVGTYRAVRWWSGEMPGIRPEDTLEFTIAAGHSAVYWG